LIATAGELATLLGVTLWREGEVTAAAAWALEQWISQRGGTEPAEARQALEQVRRFIEAHGEYRFEPLDNVEARAVPNRAGWRKGEGLDREWLIPSETWRNEICAGLDPKFVARTLGDAGILRRASDGFQQVRRIRGTLKQGPRPVAAIRNRTNGPRLAAFAMLVGLVRRQTRRGRRRLTGNGDRDTRQVPKRFR
jgi:uncharacterized protein (DUF927 family)